MYATKAELWTLNSTIVDASQEYYNRDVARRTKERGIVASILTAFTYSGTVNSSLDKLGKINPATSTVLIGMFLGNVRAAKDSSTAPAIACLYRLADPELVFPRAASSVRHSTLCSTP
jgi:hypothetical protein